MTNTPHPCCTPSTRPRGNRRDLVWESDEHRELERRILTLRSEQIAELFSRVGIRFDTPTDTLAAAKEVQREGHESLHFNVLLTEAESHDALRRHVRSLEEGIERP